MKTLFVILILITSVAANAQIQSVSIQASGLTCSMCSNAINKALKTLDFVSSVDADIRTYTFNIAFKQNSLIDFELIKNKVEKAGFKVSSFYVTMQFDHIQLNAGEPVFIQQKSLVFVNTASQDLTGEKRVKVLNKGFVPAKEYKRNNYADAKSTRYYVSL